MSAVLLASVDDCVSAPCSFVSLKQEDASVHTTSLFMLSEVQMTAAGDLPEATWPHWGEFSLGYHTCCDPAEGERGGWSAAVTAQQPWEPRVPCRSGRLLSLQGGPRTPMTSRDLTRTMRRVKISLMTARWRNCFSSKSLQTSDRGSKGCSSCTLTSSGEAGSSTWPPVTST